MGEKSLALFLSCRWIQLPLPTRLANNNKINNDHLVNVVSIQLALVVCLLLESTGGQEL